MNYKHFIGLILVLFILSCKKENHLTRIEGHRLDINDSLTSAQSIEDFIKPFRTHVNKNLDSVISYSKHTYSKNDGELNTAVGNLMADIVYEQGNSIYESRTGNKIDMVILNHGGIRSIISKGNITARTAFKLMPFENNIVVIEMKGIYVKELVAYLQKAKRAHPISGLEIHLNANYELVQATINGAEIVDDKLYSVASSDYLYSGGDNMDFLQKGDSLHDLDYKIRNAIIDYFKKYDTISPVIDDRFIKIN